VGINETKSEAEGGRLSNAKDNTRLLNSTLVFIPGFVKASPTAKVWRE